MRRALLLLLALPAGCGSAPLPPPAGPSPAPVTVEGRQARLDTRARTLTVGDQHAAAGVGPTHLAAAGGRVYVTDTVQGALLIFDLEPRLHLQRRVSLPGGPADIAVRGDRLLVTLRDRREVVELTADGAAKLRDRHRPAP